MATRREFLKDVLSFAAVAGITVPQEACRSNDPLSHIAGGMVGANHKTGHLLRTADQLPPPESFKDVDVLIIGGGISGLSAKRWLAKNGRHDVLMIEMDKKIGGNSRAGGNRYSAYPWGAHYMPVPEPENKDLLEFLSEIDVVTGYDKAGRPVYNEYFLCHEPEERLYIHGHWQEGLVPQVGISSKDKDEIARFFSHIDQLKFSKGNDGKFAFSIPVDTSSMDAAYKVLDNITFSKYLSDNGYTSPYLRWYLEYCCKDDYGSSLAQTSAWAGLHYFASRRGEGANASASDVLTWPEGNSYLMEGLSKSAPENIITDTLVYNVVNRTTSVEVHCYDTIRQSTYGIRANKILLATPQYVNKYLLPDAKLRAHAYSSFTYAPWIVANITFSNLPQTKGMGLCWDNVIYGKPSVGYVYANHQDLNSKAKGVITYYLPVLADEPAGGRIEVYNKDYNHWRKYIVEELQYAHKGVEKYITHMDIWTWGHGMIRPMPGFITGKERAIAAEPIDNRIFFAHSDLSGVSIFEEAFYQGIKAAKAILNAS